MKKRLKEDTDMKTIDIVKPVCKGFVCGALLAVASKPFEFNLQGKKVKIHMSSLRREKKEG